MLQPEPHRFSTIDLVEGFHLGHAVSTLRHLGIFDSLRQSLTAEEIARTHKLDPTLLRGVLEYVAVRTDLVRKTGKRFVATKNYTRSCRFLLDLYAGAYGKNAVQLKRLMNVPSAASNAVDRIMHARAFTEIGGLGLDWIAQLIRQLKFNHILDIGCGPAYLLVQLAAQDHTFIGWGLETNPAMCKAARVSIRGADIGRRIRIIEGDSTRLSKVLPATVCAKIKTVTACQVANEMFGSDFSQAVTWLRGIQRMLPGRTLLLADYYGRLGSKRRENQRETLLHDYAQLISGQGVPPTDIRKWRAIYARAGCQLVHAIEDTKTTRFIHILML